MPLAHPLDRLSQTSRALLSSHVVRTRRLEYLPRATLERWNLQRQNAKATPALRAAAQRHRRLALFQLAKPGPQRVAHHPTAEVHQMIERSAGRAQHLRTDRFAFDSGGLQGIISDGDGNGDNFRFSTRYGCSNTRTSLPPKVANLLPQPSPCQAVVHSHPLVSLSFLIFKFQNSEPVRRECQ
jgi:hypothetical protein